MYSIRLPDFTVEEAEAAVARLWTRLEEHALATPILIVTRSGKLLDLEITFASQAEAELALGGWRQLAAAAA